MTKRRAVLYARKSSKEEAQEGETSKSVADQLTDMRAYAVAQGMVVVAEHFDDAVSGREESNRPGMLAVRASVDLAEVDALVLDTKSRLFRNSAKREAMMQDLDERGVEVHAVSQGGLIRRGTAHDWFVDSLDGIMDDRLWRERSEGWRKAHRRRAERGLLPGGVVPLGYVKDGRSVVPGPEADDVVEMFEMYAQGAPVREIARRMGRLPQNAKRVLRNEFYIGHIKYKGQWRDGVHEPLVSPQLWARCQQRLRDESFQPARHAEPRSPLLGLLRCGACGGSLTVVNGDAVACARFRKYKTCETGIGAPRIGVLEDLLINILQDSCWGQHQHGDGDVRGRAQKRLNRAERDLHRAEEGRTRLVLALAEGRMSDDAFDAAMPRLEDQVLLARKVRDEARDALLLTPADQDSARLVEIASVLRVLPPSEGRERLRREFARIVVHRLPDGDRKPYTPWRGGIELVFRG